LKVDDKRMPAVFLLNNGEKAKRKAKVGSFGEIRAEPKQHVALGKK
jgi:hypothetical protein